MRGNIARFVVDTHCHITTLYQPGTEAGWEMVEQEEWTGLQMAEAIRDLVGTAAPIEYRDLPVNDPKVRQPKIERAREKLDWSPQMDIREGLKLTMEDFRRRVG